MFKSKLRHAALAVGRRSDRRIALLGLVLVLCLGLGALSWLGGRDSSRVSAHSGDLSAQPVRDESDPAIPNPGHRPPQDNDIRFERISLEEGLSQSVVTSILQDSRGFMWFGTQDGLNRFDGYDFVVYRHDPEDPNSPGGSYIWALKEGQDGALWLGTDSGLDRFDPLTGEFTHYRHDPADPNSLGGNSVRAIVRDETGTLWISLLEKGLDRFDPQTGQFTHYRHDPDDPTSLTSDSVQAIHLGQDGLLWIGTEGSGFGQFDPATEVFTHFRHPTDEEDGFDCQAVHAIVENPDGTLWIGSGGGLDLFDPETAEFTHYRHDPEDPNSLSEGGVSDLLLDREGTLWIGMSEAGMNRLDPGEDRFVHYYPDPSDAHSLSSTGAKSLFQDREGGIWVGTFGGGLSRFAPSARYFALYRHNPYNSQSLSSNSIWSIHQTRSGELWVGTSYGLNRMDRETGKFTHYFHDPDDPHSISADTVWSIFEDQEGMLWLGTDDGIDRFDRATEQFTHYGDISAAFAILPGPEGTLWLGTWGSGLVRFDPETETFVTYQNDPEDPTSLSYDTVSVLEEDEEGMLWVGTFGAGLNRFDPQTETFTRYWADPEKPGSLSHNVILSIHQDRRGIVWVGTHEGLNRFNPENDTFTDFRREDGLPNDVIYGILEDDQGNLWLSTNVGISCFDPRTGKFSNYTVQDGLQSNEFNQNAYFRNDAGEMFFGGINGLSAFHPARIEDNAYVPPVVLTSLTQGGEPVATVADGLTEVTFDWPNNFFAFEFAALSFAQPEQNQYAYRLEGFEEDWNYVGDRRFGRYTNVPAGSYTLRVIGANNDGVWNEEGVSVAIAIVPPFWQTWWFRVLLVVGGVGAVLAVVNLRVRVVESQRRQLETQVSERTRELRSTLEELKESKEAAEAANRAKSAFLANMSHELRTPLNAILGFTQLMSRDVNLTSTQQENLGIINQSGEHLLGLINDVLELSKIEAGRMTLNEQPFDLYRLLEGLEEMFRIRARSKGLSLICEQAPNVPRFVQADVGKLRQVLMNLLGNAVKFSEQGHVALRVRAVSLDGQDDERMHLRFAVEDTGPGIAPDELEALFAPFEQTAAGLQSQEGTGLGLPISLQYVRLMGGELNAASPSSQTPAEGGPGSVFTFTIPATLADSSEVETAQPTRCVIGLAPGQPIYRVLVVEDDRANRRLLTQLLSPLGFQVRTAVNGQEALEIWDRWEPHVILMDMRMPVMNGYETTRRIKSTAKGQDTVIIALTASAMKEDRAAIMAGGCDDFIRKPFREEELFDALTKHLGVRFLCEEPVSAAPETYDLSDASLAAVMSNLPADLVRRLERATNQGDLAHIAGLIDEIRPHNRVLAATLDDWARAFDHDAILELIATSRETA
ncbi:MAG: two-component regulator propeller domain-containing protein [Anaerolineae bacterium]